MFGPWGTAIGAGLGAILGAFRGNAEKAINPIREAFVQAAGGLDALNKKAHDAGTTLDAMLNAKNEEQYKKAIDDLNAAFKKMDDWVNANSKDMKTLLGQAVDLGVKLPKSISDAIQKFIDLGKLTGDTGDLLKALTDGSQVDFKKMQSIAEKYGIDLKSLGPAFQAAQIHDKASEIINDFDYLQRGGADIDTVLTGLKKPIIDLVQQSLIAGVALPANMKPWVEQLGLTHQLIDENGNELTDTSRIKFADPIVTEFQKIIDKLQELIDKISAGITGPQITVPPPIYAPAGPNNPEPQAMGTGGIKHATGPRVFYTAGNEDYWFGGEGANAKPLPGLDQSQPALAQPDIYLEPTTIIIDGEVLMRTVTRRVARNTNGANSAMRAAIGIAS